MVHSDVAAEESVLGAVLLSDAAMGLVEEVGLSSKHFYVERHGVVFGAMLELARRGEPVDQLTVCAELDRVGRLELVGGRQAVDRLSAAVPFVAHVQRYAEIVKKKWLWRQRFEAVERAREAVAAEDLEGLSRSTGLLDEADPVQSSAVMAVDEVADNFLAWYEQRPGTVGIPTPFVRLTDALGGGFGRGQMTVVGGWPGHLKSAFVDQVCVRAHREGLRCVTMMNELQDSLRTGRILAQVTGATWQQIKSRTVPHELLPEILRTLDGRMPTEYVRVHGRDIDEIARIARRLRPDMLVVDSCSRIPPRPRDRESFTNAVERVSGTLADLALDLNCHLVAVVQLNLERCKTPVRPLPTARDLLNGGAWHRDARNCIFTWRKQEEIRQGKEIVGANVLDYGLISTDKASSGPPEDGTIQVWFNEKKMIWEERDGQGMKEPLGSETEEMAF